MLLMLNLSSCTLTLRGNQQDYNIQASVITPDCTVVINRQEVVNKRKVDASKATTSVKDP